MEKQLKVRASDQPILEEEEIILPVLKTQVLRQMLSFLPLVLHSNESSRPWWVPLPWQELWLLSGTAGCCGVSASPSILATFHAGAVLTSELLVACARLLCCETGPAIGMLRDLLKAQTLPAFTWEPSWCRGWRATSIVLFTCIICFWRTGLGTGFSHTFAFIYKYWHTAAIAHHPQQMHSKAHRRLSLEMDFPRQEKYRNLRGNHRKTNHRAEVLFISKLAVPQWGN